MAWGPSGQPSDRGQASPADGGVDADPSSLQASLRTERGSCWFQGPVLHGDAQTRPRHLEGGQPWGWVSSVHNERGFTCASWAWEGASCGLEEGRVRASF